MENFKERLLPVLSLLFIFTIVFSGTIYAENLEELRSDSFLIFSKERFQPRKEAKHPFLVFDEEFIPILKERIKREPYKTWWSAVLFTDAPHTQALAWAVTGKKTYADSARARLLNYTWTKLDSSNRSSMMEPTSHTVKIMCQAYDLIYNYPGLSEKDKETIEDKFAYIAEDLYNNVLVTAGGQNPGNQRTLGASVLGTIALTIPNYSKEGYHTPEEWLERALEAIFRQDNFIFWYEDGFFVEGVGYSAYMGLNFLPFIFQYRTATGINLFEHPVLRNWVINWGYQEMSSGLHANIGSTIMDYTMSYYREILVNEALGEDAPFFKFLYNRKLQAFNSLKIEPPKFKREGNIFSDIAMYFRNVKKYRVEIKDVKTILYPALHINTWVDLLCYYDDSIVAEVPKEHSPTRFFNHSQHAVLSNGWDKDSITMWLTGKYWIMPYGHSLYYSHEDVGNFIINAYGELLVVDAGYDHWASREYNLAPHHNVIMVIPEGENSSIGPSTTTQAILENQIATDFIDCVDISSVYANASFLRRVLFPGKDYFVIWDWIESSNKNRYDWLFHSPIRKDKGEILIDGNRVSWPGWDIYYDRPTNVRLEIFFAGSPEIEAYDTSKWIPISSWNYRGTQKRSIKASKFASSTGLLTVLYPYREKERTPSFKALNVQGGAGVLVQTSSGDRDLILSQGGDGYLNTGDLKTDATTFIIRQNGNDIKFISMHQGKNIELGGVEIVQSQEKITVAAKISGNSFKGWLIPEAGTDVFKVKFYSRPFGEPKKISFCGHELPFKYDRATGFAEVDIDPNSGPGEFQILLGF